MTKDDHSALIRAVKALPASQRRVVVLRHYWGHSAADHPHVWLHGDQRMDDSPHPHQSEDCPP